MDPVLFKRETEKSFLINKQLGFSVTQENGLPLHILLEAF